LQEQADEVAAGETDRQPARPGPLALQPGLEAAFQPRANCFKRLGRGGHVIGHLAFQNAPGAR
jgi:hypothetical protein